MSGFLDERFLSLVPYVPGEQPKRVDLIKLNTNESPFPPSPKAIGRAEEEVKRLNLYPDPECVALREKYAEVLGGGLTAEEIFVGNGSDEVLYLIFNAYRDRGFAFPDITYGFYPVYASISGTAYREVPLKEDYSVDVEGLIASKSTVVIANPNAPTGMALPLSVVKKILDSDKNRLVVIDEAYVDFGGESAVGLVKEYDNLLVVQTFSKSRSLAGARLGFGIANKEIIKDLNLLKYSLNPYNINRTTLALGLGVLEDEEYTKKNCKEIVRVRDLTTKGLEKLGFSVLPSKANFIFAKPEKVSAEDLYLALKERGILVRYFKKERLDGYLRITVGSEWQMKKLLSEIERITEEI